MFAVLHLPDFSLQAVLRLEDALSGRPAALLAGEGRNAAVVACTASARAARVEIGQSASQAMARCAGIALRTRNPAAEAEAATVLQAVAFGISPGVEATSPGVCTLQVAGIAPDARETVLRAGLAQLAELGLEATAGVGPTPLLALFAARRAAPVLTVADARAFLSPLPLAFAEPPPALATILRGWGIRTLGDLAALAKADVAQRLGPAGLQLRERAAGEGERPLHLLSPPRSFAVRHECEHEMETLEPLLFLLRRFVDRLALELRNAGLAAGTVQLALEMADETSHAHAIQLPEPSTSADLLFRTLHTYLESLRTAAAVVAVALELAPVRIVERQQGLFDGGLRDPRGFAETLDRVAAIVGGDRLGTPYPQDTHRPDAFELRPPPPVFGGNEQCPMTNDQFLIPHTQYHIPNTRNQGLALRRFRPPVAATVELVDRAPCYVLAAHAQGSIRERAGPWRSSGDWWEGAGAWQREEWDIELATGGLYRLIHTPAGWFIEGEYD